MGKITEILTKEQTVVIHGWAVKTYSLSLFLEDENFSFILLVASSLLKSNFSKILGS